jgi:hypothetical protein
LRVSFPGAAPFCKFVRGKDVSVAGTKLRASAVAGGILALAALAQPADADPIYHLGRGDGSGTYDGGPIGTFIIPSVAQGILLYLNADDPLTEITLTGLNQNFGEKLRCIAVTRSTFACSAEAAFQDNFGDDQDQWQANGQISGPNESDPIIQLLTGPADGPAALFQTANFTNDLPLGPASVPEPGSLILLASALFIFSITARRQRRSSTAQG